MDDRKHLRMVTCDGCGVKNFIPSDTPPLSTVACTRCGYQIMMPMQLKQFELRSLIGTGGMGSVYRAFDQSLERDVAVKLMKSELLNDPNAIEAFGREAKATASLNHTNIIHIYLYEEWEGKRFIVMELADCGSLDTRIEKEGVLPELDVLDIGIKIASALATALKHNLLHRDIKPGNILFNKEGEPKLIDFGLAYKGGSVDMYDETEVWGTPYYIAPEKIKREREDFLSDMYSLAGTLYHALTGRVPFEAPTIDEIISAHVHAQPIPPHQVLETITIPTSEAIIKALAKRPEDRYQSYDDFIMALTAARSQLLVGMLKQKSKTDSSGSGGRSWWRL